MNGTVTSKFPNDINTDDIIPANRLQESWEKKYFADYAFEKYDKSFIKRSKKSKNSIVVAGENFACGSSREQAVYALQYNNVIAVIAQSYPDIFYRNALNNGLTLITLPDTSEFDEGDKIEIDLDSRKVINKTNNKEYKFEMEDHVAETFKQGGTIGKVKKHLRSLSRTDGKSCVSSKKTITKSTQHKPQTMVEKIVSRYAGKSTYAGNKIEKLPITKIFFNEVLGAPGIVMFKEDFPGAKVFDKKRVFMIPDHSVPSPNQEVSEAIDLMEEFSKEQGVRCFKEGDGIEHAIMIEQGEIVPWDIVLGTDSHTDTNGAVGALAFGVGTTDAEYAMATGHIYDFEVPKSMKIALKGKLPKGVYAKDIILHIIGKLGAGGCSKMVAEFTGEGVKNLSIEARATMANMAVEMSARTGIFPTDEVTIKYLKDRAKWPVEEIQPDKDAKYEQEVEVNLSKLEPCVAFPHKPANVTFVSKLEEMVKKSKKSKNQDFVPADSLKVTDAFIGSCTNGRYEDLEEAAKVLKGRKVHPGVNLIVIPASRETYIKAAKNGLIETFAEAGANIESPNCAICFGKHMGVLSGKARMIASNNRNYIGRMGSEKALIFLASPATVAASAVKGEVADPRKYL